MKEEITKVQMRGKNKFVLIDNSLKGWGGHCYEYAERVLQGAEHQGYDPILAAHKNFLKTDQNYHVFSIYALEEDFFLKRIIHRKANLFNLSVTSSFFKGKLKEIIKILDAKIRSFFFSRSSKFLLQSINPIADDIFFVPNATPYTLESLYPVLVDRKNSIGTWHILIRWDFPSL